MHFWSQYSGMSLKKIAIHFAFATALFLGYTACKAPNTSTTMDKGLRHGDVLFCGTTGSDLSNAIDVVTKTDAGHNYTHMGILCEEEGVYTVLHAYPGTGVTEDPLESFINGRKAEGSDVYAYRVQHLPETQAQNAIEIARKVLGKPYNDSYILTETEQKDYYCSQLVYEAFAEDSVFTLYPMSFKDPATDSIYPAWISYYDSLGVAIPQDALGCNPNKMATNERLEFIGQLPLTHKSTAKN